MLSIDPHLLHEPIILFNAMTEIENIRYAQRQRLQFIESVAFWEGEIDRPRVCKVFHVSENHVTRDFRLYRQSFPENLDYDITSRVYRPSREFRPHIASGRPEEYLSLLRSYTESQSAALVPAIGQGVRSASLPAPSGQIEPEVLFLVTRAIKCRQGLSIQYQSLNTPHPTSRVVWPHTLICADFRWRIRAFDEKYGKYLDLVLTRILSVSPTKVALPAGIEKDAGWENEVLVEITPFTGLSRDQKRVVGMEYGMTQKKSGWGWSVAMRECLVPYFLKTHRLDLDDPTAAFPISLANPELAKRYRFPPIAAAQQA
jgi:hypothetical protein